MPEVAAYFHAGAVATSWILLSYMLFNTILILVFGKLADIYGRRGLYLFGLIEFTIVSFLCGLAPNVSVLIFLRILQAVGAALVITNTTSLIADAFSEGNLGTALSINTFVISASALIGPAVGGFLVSAFGWRWVFWFNVPIGIIGFIWGILTLRSVPGRAKDEKVDVWGNITIFLALGGLILALSESGVTGWTSFQVILGLLLFFVFIPCFWWVEQHTEFPTIDFALFRNRPFAMANLATFLNALARSSVVLLIALYFQVVDQENPFVAGLKVIPITIGMLIGSPLVGALSAKYSTRLLSTAGLFVTCIGMFLLMWHIGVNASVFWISLGQFLIGFGTGFFQPTNTKAIMLSVPADRRGIANGLRSMLQNMGVVISTALSLMIVTSALPTRLKDAFYSGAAAHFLADDAAVITRGYRIVFLVMLLLTVLAIAASYLRSEDTGTPRYRKSSREITD